jgi:hypothetical protein
MGSKVEKLIDLSGVEWFSDPNDREAGRITWVSDGEKSWEMLAGSTGPNARTEIGQRLISEEPMAMVSHRAILDLYPHSHDLGHLGASSSIGNLSRKLHPPRHHSLSGLEAEHGLPLTHIRTAIPYLP